MQNRACCFTGHTFISNQKIPQIKKYLRLEVLKLIIDKGIISFYVGSEVGFYNLCSLTVLELKKIKKEIELHLILPYPQGQKHLYTESITEHEEIKCKADSVEYIPTAYCYNNYTLNPKKNKYLINKHLVNKSDVVMAYCESHSSSNTTKNTITYAEKQSKPVINLYNHFRYFQNQWI